MHDVSTPTVDLDRLGPLIGAERLADVRRLATRMREGLGDSVIWNVNSTASGGGVAEMLVGLVAYSRGAGVDTRWLVAAGDADFFTLTKRIHNGLHGSPGDGGPLGAAERRHYDAVSATEGAALKERISAGDVVILHDPQTLGLVGPALEAGAKVIWRCHIGTEERDELSTRTWQFLRPYLERAPVSVFSRTGYVPPFVPPNRVAIIAPAIDPYSAKNEDLAPQTVASVLRRIGYVDATGVQTPEVRWAAEDGTGRVVSRSADVVGEDGPPPIDVPVVVQVSRWDRLKDMQGLLEAFAAGLAPQGYHLALVGPSVTGVADDPEGAEVLAECTRAWEAQPPQVRRQIRLVSLPMQDGAENASMVNAIQRHAAVVVQKSLMEGFGLTVAEAMWKSRPVVASGIGGILDQIDDGESGLLLSDPHNPTEVVAALRKLLQDPARADRLAAAAHLRVHQEFLPDRQLRQWAELIQR